MPKHLGFSKKVSTRGEEKIYLYTLTNSFYAANDWGGGVVVGVGRKSFAAVVRNYLPPDDAGQYVSAQNMQTNGFLGRPFHTGHISFYLILYVKRNQVKYEKRFLMFTHYIPRSILGCLLREVREELHTPTSLMGSKDAMLLFLESSRFGIST